MSSTTTTPSATIAVMPDDVFRADSSQPERVSPPATPLQALRDLPGLSGATARAAGAILSAPGEAARSSITDLARKAGVSPSTLSRLATQLGYDGFTAMRAAIATEHGREIQGGWERDIGTQISTDDDPGRVLAVLVANQNRATRNATAALDLTAARRAADWIATAGRIHLYGDWGDSVALHELYLRLLRIGRPVWFQESRIGIHVSNGLLRSGDVLVCLSRSGHDEVAEVECERARAQGARTVVITGDPGTALSRRADAALFTGTRPGSNWTEYFGGRTSDTLTASLLWVLVAQRVPDGLGITYGTPETEE